ncbi:uncharacterized protein A4U43_C07F3020 [Asparagus officinalis]|uniref:DUF674 family protein n=1 Tax=Asparagus officinalis TaxID=4686 RepID=A0A5P1E951_ASPOF|nr:uncharacterized protein A4U43_C07F3020 [Asparagus officinalis]
MATITIKLLIDKEKNRVVFAESDKDFVDILFGFLTLPTGTIIRVLNKQSSLGSLDKLYESVETLETKNLETEACKSMLLQPRCSAESLCEDLLINVDDSKPWRIYTCQSFDCAKNYRHYSSVSGARCSCGKLMDKLLQCYLKQKGDVFLKGEGKYIISDDLHVSTASIDSTLSLLQKLEIKDADNLEKRVVDVCRDEVLALLKRSFQSKTPLSDVFLREPTLFSRDKQEAKVSDATQINLGDESESTDQTKTISIKLLQNRALNLLKACLISHNALNNVFAPKAPKKAPSA